MPRVGIKFCGGCNSFIERGEVLKEVREIVKDFTFAGFQEPDLDAYLFVCGCPTACPVEEMGFLDHPHTVVVAGESVDERPVPEAELARVVAEKLLRLVSAEDGSPQRPEAATPRRHEGAGKLSQ